MTSPSPTPRRDVACRLALIALCAAFFGLSTRWLGFYAWGIDEGMYVMRARMMGEGFALYRDIWFNPMVEVGGRWHFRDKITLTMRVGYPMVTVGVSFFI